MNNLKQQYIEEANQIMNCLNDAEKFLLENDFTHEAEIIANQRENLEKREFSIAVIGEFSAGKSTFLNALMGERMLPSFTKETTATINFLRHKEKAPNGESGIVYYNDGKTEAIDNADLKTISKYVSTDSYSIDVAKSVKHLDLFLDSKFLEGNVTLVDTPGLNGIAEGHKEITQDQIEKSSASIFLFDANKPGSKTDFDTLTELRKRVKSIIFVLNKIDSIKSSEGETVESVIEKLKENYKKVYPDATSIPEIWPIAAYPALVARSNSELEYLQKTNHSEEEKEKFERDSRMKAFEERLWKFLTRGEKTIQELSAPLDQLDATLVKIKNELENQKNVLSGTVDSDDLEKQKIELNKALESLNEELAEKTKDLKSKMKDIDQAFIEEVEAESERFKKNYMSQIENFEKIEEIQPDYIENDINRKLSRIAEDAYTHYLDNINDLVNEYNADFTQSINEKFSSSLIISIDRKLDLPAMASIGLEQYEEEIKNREAEIKQLNEECDKVQSDLLTKMKNEEKRERLQRELDSIKEKRNCFEENSLYTAPSIKQTQKTNKEYVKRNGFFGKIANFFDGGIREDVTHIEYDSREYDEFMRRRATKLDNYDNEIAEISAKLSNLGDDNADAAKIIYEKKQAILEEKRKAETAYVAEFKEKVISKNSSELRKQKRAINEYIEDMTDDFKKKAKNELRNKRDAQAASLQDVIANSVTEKIKNKNSELEFLEKQMAGAIEERNSSLNKIDAQLASIRDLLVKSEDIRADIDGIPVDKIEEISLESINNKEVVGC